MVGLSQSQVYFSFATGAVTALAPGAFAGGLVGKQTFTGFPQKAEVVTSYSTGSVTGVSGATLGGVLGRHDNGSVTTSYSIGAGSGASTIGGVIGSDNPTSTGRSALYWDLQTSGVTDASQGAGDIPNDSGITGLSDAQLKSGLPSGFKANAWAENPSINNGYPYLIANPPP